MKNIEEEKRGATEKEKLPKCLKASLAELESFSLSSSATLLLSWQINEKHFL